MQQKAFKRKAKELLQGIWGRAAAILLFLVLVMVFFSVLEKTIGGLLGIGTLEVLLAPLFLTGQASVYVDVLIYTSVLWLATMLLTFLFLTPAKQGAVLWYYKCASGEAAPVSSAFHCYTGIHRWAKTLLVYLLLYLRIAFWTVLLVVPGVAMYFVYGFTVMYGSLPWLSFLLLLVAIGLALAGLVVSLVVCYRYFLVPYILADDPNVRIRTAFRSSVRIMAGKKGTLFSLDISFLPYYLLGLLLLPLLGTVPYISMTKALYAKQFIMEYQLSVMEQKAAVTVVEE